MLSFFLSLSLFSGPKSERQLAVTVYGFYQIEPIQKDGISPNLLPGDLVEIDLPPRSFWVLEKDESIAKKIIIKTNHGIGKVPRLKLLFGTEFFPIQKASRKNYKTELQTELLISPQVLAKRISNMEEGQILHLQFETIDEFDIAGKRGRWYFGGSEFAKAGWLFIENQEDIGKVSNKEKLSEVSENGWVNVSYLEDFVYGIKDGNLIKREKKNISTYSSYIPFSKKIIKSNGEVFIYLKESIFSLSGGHVDGKEENVIGYVSASSLNYGLDLFTITAKDFIEKYGESLAIQIARAYAYQVDFHNIDLKEFAFGNKKGYVVYPTEYSGDYIPIKRQYGKFFIQSGNEFIETGHTFHNVESFDFNGDGNDEIIHSFPRNIPGSGNGLSIYSLFKGDKLILLWGEDLECTEYYLDKGEISITGKFPDHNQEVSCQGKEYEKKFNWEPGSDFAEITN
ncbi:hypothetical protein EHQ52_05790 [Leptospira koniambonensis]|uniref:Uncharacterized protein n=1 Tax=Leptospira koniambonensis TaxID=2484950 RepID=A0A4R9J6R0_9LEPT|nr:hypothetical protein [Leptospira koniambonensis]TGL34035.1 hypothetical protein EHQ52_05790 [Leptospira koniambonensis]